MEKETFKGLLGFIVIIFIVYSIIKSEINRSHVKEQLDLLGRYTIAETNRKSGKYISFKFSYQGKSYESSHRYGKTYSDRYIVKFLPSNPNNVVIADGSYMAPECFPDSLIPQEGWSEIPVCKRNPLPPGFTR
jgi:hypothetical protein